jgi:hypothetical protein
LIEGEAVLEVLKVSLFGLLDEWEDDVGLSSFLYLCTEEVEELGFTGVITVDGLNGLASRWKLIDDGEVEVTVEGHGEGSWDRCSGHDQDMRRGMVFSMEEGTLGDTEAVLFVDDGQSKGMKGDGGLNEGVSADEDVDVPGGNEGEEFFAGGGRCGAGEKGDIEVERGQEMGECFKMLCGKDFSGSHDGGLVTIVDSQEGGEKSDDGFTGADISL